MRLTPALRLPTERFPWDDLRKIFCGCQWVAKVPNGVETLPKISTGWVGRNERCRRQMTDLRTTTECTFAENRSTWLPPLCQISWLRIKHIRDITLVRDVVLVAVSALKRADVPKRRRGPDAPRPPYYLALTHGHLLRRPTWRLRIVPANYRLRYICQRGSLPARCITMFFTRLSVGCKPWLHVK